MAVATNFVHAAEDLVAAFSAGPGAAHRIRLASASTGKHYAQIRNGAPFDVFLAADQARPERLVEDGLARAGARVTYAIGSIVLWSASDKLSVTNGEAALRGARFRRLAIANPALAPYGVAARQVLTSLALLPALEPKLVYGQNIGQTHALVASGNAELGFIARSQWLMMRGNAAGSVWTPPPRSFDPIRQDGMLLRRAERNEAAVAFMEFLVSAAGKRIIRDAGYEVP